MKKKGKSKKKGKGDVPAPDVAFDVLMTMKADDIANHVDGLLSQSEWAMNQDLVAEIAALLEVSISKYPKNIRLKVLWAELLIEATGRYSEAAEVLEPIVQMDDRVAARACLLLVHLIGIRMSESSEDESQILVDRAFELIERGASLDDRPVFGLAAVDFLMTPPGCELPDAENKIYTILVKLLESHPSDFTVLSSLGFFKLAQGDLESSKLHLTKASEMVEPEAQTGEFLALLRHMLDLQAALRSTVFFLKARELLEVLSSRNDVRPQADYLLCILYSQAKDYGGPKNCLDDAQEALEVFATKAKAFAELTGDQTMVSESDALTKYICK